MLNPKEKFFEGEERENFFVDSRMKRYWASQIEVLEEIKRICDKYKIKYFAEWGTLLGAVRHKGIIPWDDDIDIGMLRDDWNRFAQIAPQELDAWFEMKNIYNDTEQDNCIMRVINSRHMNFDTDFLERFHMCPFSTGIDIFPIDYIPRDSKKDKDLVHLIHTLMVTAATVSEEPPYTSDDREIAEMWEKTLGIKIDWNNRLHHEIKKMVDMAMQQCTPEEADEVCSMMRRQNGQDYHVPKEYYDEWIDMPFEYTTIPVPKNYDYILKLKYGEDYMTPKQIRGGHDYPNYKEQELALKAVMEQTFQTQISYEQMQGLIDMKVFGETT